MDAIKKNGDDNFVEIARALIVEYEAGKNEQVDELLGLLSGAREKGLFSELGKLTRDLHNAINNFTIDTRISDLTEDEIPDAKDRLRHVITMTEDAANKTLSAIEVAMPICDDLQKDALKINDAWEKFMQREMEAEEFRGLCRQVDNFLNGVVEKTGIVNSGLSTVLMAQSFQDLTGQIIRRVISLVEDVEDNLVNLIRISGQQLAGKEETGKKNQDAKLSGPQIPGMEDSNALSGQDEVDDLLSSLGF
ncbi:MAG: protein phosphatase CheZ [Gammaproteobacteria bacterium]|nr:MAG: protein phosphatase CheZ [Gammaproteobacteria bacterium]